MLQFCVASGWLHICLSVQQSILLLLPFCIILMFLHPHLFDFVQINKVFEDITEIILTILAHALSFSPKYQRGASGLTFTLRDLRLSERCCWSLDVHRVVTLCLLISSYRVSKVLFLDYLSLRMKALQIFKRLVIFYCLHGIPEYLDFQRLYRLCLDLCCQCLYNCHNREHSCFCDLAKFT